MAEKCETVGRAGRYTNGEKKGAEEEEKCLREGEKQEQDPKEGGGKGSPDGKR